MNRKVVQVVVDAVKREATAGSICLSVETAKSMFAAVTAEEKTGKSTLREIGWTAAYCLMEYEWSDEARTFARSKLVEAVAQLFGSDSGEGEVDPSPAKKPHSVGGFKIDQHLLGIARKFAGGVGGTKAIPMEGVKDMWKQAMKDGKVQAAERWTFRYIIAGFVFEKGALKWLVSKIREGDLSHTALSDDQPRILLVSDNLPKFELLIRATKENIVVVPVAHSSWSISDLLEAIKERAGEPSKQYASVGILDHGHPGEFCLLKDIVALEEIKNRSDLQEFFKVLGRYVRAPLSLGKWQSDLAARIDLMACSVADSDEGMALVDYLEKLTGVNWAASKTKIGAGEDVPDGFNWAMETEEQMGEVHVCYFELDKLAKWKHSAFFGIISNVCSAVRDVAGTVNHVRSGCTVM